MAQLVFEIKNQWISRTDTFKPVAKSKNYLYAQFNFLTDEWVGVPTAIFRNKTSAYEQIIGQDGTCLVPWEVIDVEGDSEIFVSVFCGDLVTANKARVHVYDTGYGDDLESDTPPTPSVYEQILNRMAGIEEDMDDATQRAESAAESAEYAAEHYPIIMDEYWYVWDVVEHEYVDTNIKAEAHDGTSATVEVEQIVGGHRVIITDASGEHIFDVPDGRDGTDGRGIASLEKTSTSGDVDQYTMTFSDGSEPFVYYVTNGASATISTRAITNGYRLTITDKNGTRAIDVLNGAQGDPGNGIRSIDKIGSYENYDYYEIRMTNGNKTSFTVTNGYSPTVEIVNITGGHRVIITDTNGAHSFDVMDGEGGGGVAIHICSSSEYDHTTGVPTIQNPEENTFYLVPSSESATHDMFVEWVYVNNAWEMFGSASIDLSQYATKTELNGKVDKVTGKSLSTNDYTTEEKNKLSGIEAQANKTIVDDALSSTSTNPVQNKKVKEALDNLDAGDIAYDDEETYSEGSVGDGLSSVKAEINQLSESIAPVESTTTATAAHAVGELFMMGETLLVALSAIAVGDTITTDGGSPNAAVTTLSSKLLKDVQVNGTSVVSQGVANIPSGGQDIYGVYKLDNTGSGLQIYNGYLTIYAAIDALVKLGAASFTPITPLRQHLATFYGLAKIAGADEKNSTLTAGTYSENAKSKISDMLNSPVTVSGTTPTITAMSGVRYVCGEVATLSITPPASGCCDIVFESGSTPTVLTVPNTVKWANGFDPTSLDANTTYEINIMDGLGVAVAWT